MRGPTSSTRPSSPRSLTVALLTALAMLAGCGTTEMADAPDVHWEGEPDSSPFTVGQVPDGYEPVTAGVGNGTPDWGSDSTGTHEPFTVLAPTGSTDPAQRVVVSTTGFEGYQGKLDQTLYDHSSDQPAQRITIDDRDALHIPARGGEPAVLVAVRDVDLAVKVVAPAATLDELTGILHSVQVPEDRTRAPEVLEPPAGLEVLGSVDVDAVMAMWFFVEANTDRLRVLDSTHVAGWMTGPPAVDEGGPRPGDLSVMTLPGRAADRDVLPSFELWGGRRNWTWENVEVGGDPALAIEMTEQDSSVWTRRSVWRWTAAGDIVVVTTSTYGDETLPIAALTELAAAVEPADTEAWDRFVVEMTGGPGLNPDPGRTEIARGTHGDVEWLLQTAPQGNGEVYSPGVDPTVVDAVDPCLKLSNRQRACVAISGGPFDWVGGGVGGRSQVTYEELVIVRTTLEAAAVRITTPAGTAEVPLTVVPGGSARAAVAFVDEPGVAACTTDFPTEPPEGMTFMRIDALDTTGTVLGCIGMGGHPLAPG